jgi:hypothetical protein
MGAVEYALRLTAPVAPRGDPRDALPATWRGLLPGGALAALYFGSEFCEDRLPDLVDAIAYCELAHARDCAPTLQTPLVSPRGLRRVDGLLAGLVAEGHRPAVVFNDWGVLRLLRERHPALPRRAGRLVNRSLRDPRAYRDAPLGFATHESSRFARLRRMLARAGVEAVESDADLTGGYLGDGRDDDEAPLERALHLPFTFAASGRACPLKAGLSLDGGFAKALADDCPAPCRGKPMPIARADTALPHWRGGNTLFYELPCAAARSWLPRADRIVVHETPAP